MTPFADKYYRTADIKNAINDLRSRIAIDFAMLPTMKEQNAARKAVRKQLEILKMGMISIDHMSCTFAGDGDGFLGFFLAFHDVGLSFRNLLNGLTVYTREQAINAKD